MYKLDLTVTEPSGKTWTPPEGPEDPIEHPLEQPENPGKSASKSASKSATKSATKSASKIASKIAEGSMTQGQPGVPGVSHRGRKRKAEDDPAAPSRPGRKPGRPKQVPPNIGVPPAIDPLGASGAPTPGASVEQREALRARLMPRLSGASGDPLILSGAPFGVLGAHGGVLGAHAGVSGAHVPGAAGMADFSRPRSGGADVPPMTGRVWGLGFGVSGGVGALSWFRFQHCEKPLRR